MVSTVLAVNAGSSSVKISLLLPQPLSSDKKGSFSRHPPARLVTAHAERLLTPLAVLHIAISTSAVDLALVPSAGGTAKRPVQTTLNRSKESSLCFPARSTSFHFENEEATIKNLKLEKEGMTHEDAIKYILDTIHDYSTPLYESIAAVGHRVVHGGTRFVDSVVVDDDVLKGIESVSHLAPLHNPANLTGIKIALSTLPRNVPSVAVFDTSYHCATMPRVAYTYPLPNEYRTDLEIRKYGFHGTSVRYVARRAICVLDRQKGVSDEHNVNRSGRMVVAHLGNGASVTAVVDGKSVDTSMGFTPLSGLMMGTRSGSVDPSVVPYAARRLRKSADDIVNDMNKRSGLKAISNGDHDMRSILHRAHEGDEDALLAADMFVYRLAQHIASMMVACGGMIDALVFTAGIGENSAEIRKRTVGRLGPMLGDVQIDEEMNEVGGKGNDGVISIVRAGNSKSGIAPIVLVIPTDEEAMISDECARLVGAN